MRKITCLLIAAVIVSLFGAVANSVIAAENGKIGYIDVATVFDSYDKTKEEDVTLASRSEVKKKERERVVSKIRNMKDELELLSDKQREKKQEAIDKEIRNLQDFDRETKSALLRERDDMVRDILKEIDLDLQEYAKKNGYAMILNQRILLYADEQYDLTSEIVNILNSKYRRKK